MPLKWTLFRFALFHQCKRVHNDQGSVNLRNFLGGDGEYFSSDPNVLFCLFNDSHRKSSSSSPSHILALFLKLFSFSLQNFAVRLKDGIKLGGSEGEAKSIRNFQLLAFISITSSLCLSVIILSDIFIDHRKLCVANCHSFRVIAISDELPHRDSYKLCRKEKGKYI